MRESIKYFLKDEIVAGICWRSWATRFLSLTAAKRKLKIVTNILRMQVLKYSESDV